MQIVERIGDLIAGDETLLVHGCNAQGEFGAGVALAIRKRIPVAYRVYRELYLLRGLTLGEVIWAFDIGGEVTGCPNEPPSTARSRIVGNAITQEFYGPGGTRYVDYDAVRQAMRHVDNFVARTHGDIAIAGVTPITHVGMPLIGGGLGGGDWSIISQIIEAESRHFTPVVYRL